MSIENVYFTLLRSIGLTEWNIVEWTYRVDIYGGGEISSGISKINHSAGIIVDLVQVEIVTNKNNYEIQLIP